MRAIVLPRQGGKTERMLNWLLSNPNHVLIVMSVRERDRLRKKLNEEEARTEEVQRIVSVYDVMRGLTRGRWREPIYGIDELGHVLAQIVNGPVAVVSFTGTVDGGVV